MECPIPVAQYLRMSTENQQFSLPYQAAAIQRYADAHGFKLVRSYEDAGRSGLMLKRRTGLAQLLHDVVAGGQPFKAVLVYDVSRWGRFQDTDESAHYEFVCKSNKVPVYYCAETFENDGSPPATIMKTLKRVMAAEYSRELSVRLCRTKTLVTQRGFRVGGVAGYGLRRMLIAFDGSPRQILALGDVKGVASGRVILVPGPARELRLVRQIYRLFISDGRSAASIAREFNRKGIQGCGQKWTGRRVLEILTNPKYVGMAVWRRTTGPLGTKRIKVEQDQWAMKATAFNAIVDQKTFDAAQRVLKQRPQNKSNEELLHELKALLKRTGRLSQHIINYSDTGPTASTYARRFGSMRNAYSLIGYREFRNVPGQKRMELRHRKLEKSLLRRIVRTFPGEVSLVREGSSCRQVLSFGDGLRVSVLICQYRDTPWGILWRVRVNPYEQSHVTLICRCATNNSEVKDFYVLPGIHPPVRYKLKNFSKCQFQIKEHDPWLKNGRRLKELTHLYGVAKHLAMATGVSNV